MSAHTPGPWSVVRRDGTKYPTCIASCFGSIATFSRSMGAKNSHNLDANARLIAAAPDLLAAAESIANGSVMTGTFTHAETVLRYQEIARGAVAKAKGGAA